MFNLEPKDPVFKPKVSTTNTSSSTVKPKTEAKGNALADYWAANPGSMESAMKANPTAWGFPAASTPAATPAPSMTSMAQKTNTVTPAVQPTPASPAWSVANPQQKTGYADDNSSVRLWDPTLQDYVVKPIDKANVREYDPSTGTTAYYTNSQGEYVLGIRPTENFNINPETELYQENYTSAPTRPNTSPFSLGGAPRTAEDNARLEAEADAKQAEYEKNYNPDGTARATGGSTNNTTGGTNGNATPPAATPNPTGGNPTQLSGGGDNGAGGYGQGGVYTSPTVSGVDGGATNPVEPNGDFSGTTQSDGSRWGFKDQGDGVYRGPVSHANGGPAENGVNGAGGVQMNYQHARGNEHRADVTDALAQEGMTPDQIQATLASDQLNRITAQDSPIMQLAAQRGMETANSRGLSNSSLAAGASMAEMASAATPLAQQDASQMQEADTYNADANNSAEMREYELEAARRDSNAQRGTQTSQFNAGEANQLLDADRNRTHDATMRQFEADATRNLAELTGELDIEKQNIASATAKEIAQIEGDFKSLISTNDTAARVVTQLNASIADVLANDKIKSDEATTKISSLIKAANDSLAVVGAMNNLDLSNLVLGGVNGGTTGSGTSAQAALDQAGLSGSDILNGVSP